MDVTEKPKLRGRLHQTAFVFSIPLSVTLVALGRTGTARAAAAIYAIGMMALYGVSASYHRFPWSPTARQFMRKLDHSTIFIFIAATYTPLSVLALRGTWRVSILATVWGVAMVGVVLKMLRLRAASRAGTAMYVALGWTAIIAMPQLVQDLTPLQVAFLFSGGALYTAGALIYALRRPDPNPRVFGYHEIYHAFVIAGSLFHYAVIMQLSLHAQ